MKLLSRFFSFLLICSSRSRFQSIFWSLQMTPVQMISLHIHLPLFYERLRGESEFSLIWCCLAGRRPHSTLPLICCSLPRQQPERCNCLLKLTRFIAKPRWTCLCVCRCRCVSVWDKRRKKDERGENGEWAASVNTAGYPLWRRMSSLFHRGKYSHSDTSILYISNVAERHTNVQCHTAGASFLRGC